MPAPLKPNFSELGRTGLSQSYGVIQEEFLRDLSGVRWPRVVKQMLANDPVINAMLFAIEMLVRQVEWEFKPASDSNEDKEIAEFFKGCLFEDMSSSWEDTLSEILSFLPWGWSYHEVVFKRRAGESSDPSLNSKFNDGKIGWRKWPIRSQESLERWSIDDAGGIQGMIQRPAPKYIEITIPIFKSLLFRTTSHKNNPEGKALLRACYRPWYFKQQIENFEGIGIERDLAGLPTMKIPADYLAPDADAEKKAVGDYCKELVTSIRANGQEGVVYPSDVYPDTSIPMFEFTLAGTGSRRLFDTDKIIARKNQEILMRLMADFIILGHEKVGSFALAQPLSAKVLTPNGWTTMGAIKRGDKVVCPLGYESAVEDIFDHGVRPAFRITFADGRSVLADADHKWVVTTAFWKPHGVPHRPRLPWAKVAPGEYPLLPAYGVLTTKDLMDRMADGSKNSRFHVPVCDPVIFNNQKPLRVDPYILGVLLGDGWIPARRGGGIGGPTFGVADGKIISEVEQRLPKGHKLAARRSDSKARNFRISGPLGRGMNQITAGLDSFSLLGTKSVTKFVPDECLTASLEERTWLLRGLMDTDGYVTSEGQVRFTSISSRLCDDVAYLVRSLGGTASTSSRTSSSYTHPATKERIEKETTSFLLTIQMPDEIPPFHLKRKVERLRQIQNRKIQATGIVKIEEVGQEEMRCIAVSSPSQMYVTDGFVPTHNSSDKTDMFGVALGAWLKSIGDVINRHAIPRLGRLNGMPPESMPKLAHRDIDTIDLKTLGEFLKNISGAGVRITGDMAAFAVEQAKMPVPEDHEELIGSVPDEPDETDQEEDVEK